VTGTWKALYESPTQSVWSLVVLPAVFLGWLALRGRRAAGPVEPAAAGFVRRWAVVFALVALVDPIATGPLGLPLLPFVLLGDFRVFALVLAVMHPTRARGGVLLEAAAWTFVVPAFAYGTTKLVEAVAGAQASTMLWIVYEAGFVTLADAFVLWVLPRRVDADREPVRRYVRAVLGFVVLYYVLWALADVLTLNGVDAGWALRMLPNQLYYGLFVPFAYVRFFSAEAAASSASTQAAT
jgi:hypothetical protein